jgi:hypothetical protein
MAKIGVCIPSGDTWKAGFGLDLAVMLGTFTSIHPKSEHQIEVVNTQLSVLPKSRMMLAQQALEWGCTHLLWLDSDARFSKDTLDRLLGHDLDFVACNAVRRALPCTPTSSNGPGMPIWTSPDSFGLEEVHDHVGLHTALIKAEVFKKVEQPWFMTPWLVRQQEYQGEDVWFCHRAIDAGFRIWIDHDLSQNNRHSGNFDYSHQLADLGRAEYEAEAAAVKAKKEAEAKAHLQALENGDVEYVEPARSPAVLELATL